MRKGTTMSATQRRLLMGHQPACHASLMSFVLDVPTVVRYIKRKKICMKESKGSSFPRRETITHICNIGFFIYVQNTRSRSRPPPELQYPRRSRISEIDMRILKQRSLLSCDKMQFIWSFTILSTLRRNFEYGTRGYKAAKAQAQNTIRA
jgi:hypothetical protein